MVIIGSALGSFNLQATLSASSPQSAPLTGPHHPVTCPSALRLHEDGALECEHARVPADDPRTRTCIDHSIAILLLELAAEREGA